MKIFIYKWVKILKHSNFEVFWSYCWFFNVKKKLLVDNFVCSQDSSKIAFQKYFSTIIIEFNIVLYFYYSIQL